MPVEQSVAEADEALEAVRHFNPQTAKGQWERERLLPRVESASVIAHQVQMIEDGQREVRKLHRIAGISGVKSYPD